MDELFNQMDGFIKHYQPYERRFRLYPRLVSTGYIPQKRNTIDCVFATCNFSLILSGRGRYVFRGKTIPVNAPCVLLQWPGEPMHYGPYEDESWEELYLIFEGSEQKRLADSLAFPCETLPVRPIRNAAAVHAAMSEFLACPSASDCADSVDAAAWNLIMSTWLPPSMAEQSPLVPEIENALNRNLSAKVNFAELARKLGLSESTMRRRWQSVHGSQSYSKYRGEVLLKRAGRLLVETDFRIKEISEMLGFADIFYFMRRFRQLSGMTPTAYRRHYKPFPE